MELLLAILLVLRKNGVGYSRRLDQTVAGMTRFVSAYIKPDGTALQLRDGDDGRLFPFSRASIRDHRYLLGVAAHLLAIGEPGDGVELTYEALWWLGSVERADDSRSVAQPPSAARRSYAFPFSGFYFASSADGDYLASCCAGVGMRGLGGHGHNDALSFVLFTGGRDVLVDPGTYVYSADPVMRDRFRSVSYHNTARVDGREMNDILPGRMFSLLERARPKVHRWVDSERCALLIASHAGYSRPGHSLVHRRSLLFCRQRRYWKVNDRFIGDGTHFVEIFFHLATGLKPEACDDPSLVIASDGNRFRFGIFLENPSGWQVDASEAWVSPSYGVKNPSWILRFSRSAPLPVSAKFTLRTVTG
jgi:hypothetical protein